MYVKFIWWLLIDTIPLYCLTSSFYVIILLKSEQNYSCIGHTDLLSELIKTLSLIMVLDFNNSVCLFVFCCCFFFNSICSYTKLWSPDIFWIQIQIGCKKRPHPPYIFFLIEVYRNIRFSHTNYLQDLKNKYRHILYLIGQKRLCIPHS